MKKILVSGNKQLQVIDEVITPEESTQRFNKNITAEVICKADTSSYDIRVEDRKRAADVKQKMDALIKKMDETNKYEMYAERNPELKALLDNYKELVGIEESNLLTVGDLKRYLKENNIPNDTFVIIGSDGIDAYHAQKFIEKSSGFYEDKGNKGILLRRYREDNRNINSYQKGNRGLEIYKKILNKRLKNNFE